MPDATLLTVDARSAPPAAASSNGNRPARPPRPRTSLPSGRALLGGLLITIAAVGTYVAVQGKSGVPSTSYVVVTRDVDAGEHLTASDLGVEPIDLPEAVTVQAFATAAPVTGAVALAPLRTGGLLQRSQVLLAADGTSDDEAVEPSHELALRVPRERAVAGTLNRGERVDVLATYGNGANATTVVVARNAVVTSIDNEESATLGDDGGITLSLLFADDATVLRATHAKDVALLTLVRATRDGGATDTTDPTADHFSGPVSTLPATAGAATAPSATTSEAP